MAERSYTKNPGFLSLAELPDVHIVGAVVVMMDDAGEYSSKFIAVDLDAVPDTDVQEHVGGFVSTSFEIANL